MSCWITKHFRPISYLTLCLFLLNTALSVSAAYGVGSITGDGIENSTKRILVCTSQGYKWIELADFPRLSSTAPSIPTKTTIHDCPLCHIGNGIADDAIVYYIQLSVRDLFFVASQPSIRFHFHIFNHYHSANPRAPPLA